MKLNWCKLLGLHDATYVMGMARVPVVHIKQCPHKQVTSATELYKRDVTLAICLANVVTAAGIFSAYCDIAEWILTETAAGYVMKMHTIRIPLSMILRKQMP